MKRESRSKFWLMGGSVSGLLLLFLWQGLFSAPREKLIDLLFTKQENTGQIVIVAIDEPSLNALGQWPWPRAVFANLINQLQSAKVIGIDVNFKEPSRLGQADDFALEQTLKNSKPPVVLTSEILDFEQTIVAYPLDRFRQASLTGFANVSTDQDAVVRRFTPKICCEKKENSFAWALAENYKKDFLSLPSENRPRINYFGSAETFSFFSAIDILESRIPPDFFKNKAVLIGATANDLQDFHQTPFGRISGVEVQANILATILDGKYFTSSSLLTIISIVILSLAAVFLSWRLKQFWKLLGAMLGVIILYNLTVFLSFDRRFILDLFYPNLAIIISAVMAVAWQYVATSKDKKFIQESFGRYLAPEIIEELMNDPTRLKLGGQRKTVSILFSDIRGFTSLSEKLEPEKLTHILTRYLSVMSEVIMETRGIIDKYIGDAIMAFWGAPLSDSAHAAHALQAALKMSAALKDLNKEFERDGLPQLAIGIGINSGEVIVGNMGSEKRFDYTVIGDAVNLASRLEGLNKTYGTEIIISEATKNLLNPQAIQEMGVDFKKLDMVQVKGKEEAVVIYTPVAD
ncbi:MAG: adenylate cyclase [Parcubacteria group bacterium Gr01-1014_44]|nr:MAG: adenylate cyclase [Parcubacteria group bacterium Gr01-1014_44]